MCAAILPPAATSRKTMHIRHSLCNTTTILRYLPACPQLAILKPCMGAWPFISAWAWRSGRRIVTSQPPDTCCAGTDLADLAGTRRPNNDS